MPVHMHRRLAGRPLRRDAPGTLVASMPPPHCLPLVLINGLGSPRLAARAYGVYFRARGLDVSTIPQPLLLFEDIRKSARAVAKQIDKVVARTGSGKVDLIGMSLGGLIGLYYLKCCGGAQHVRTFVSVGGPLAGVPALDRVGRVRALRMLTPLRQTATQSDLQEELRAAPMPEGVKMYSVGGSGDPLTPRSCWDVEGVTAVETQHGLFPIGHWLLFTHPNNLQTVFRLLTRDQSD
jgi:triacylglycerol lipase